MPHPATISLVSVGRAVIAGGVKFRYAEASDLIKRRIRRKKQQTADRTGQASSILVEVATPMSIQADAFARGEVTAEIKTDRVTENVVTGIKFSHIGKRD